MRNKFVVGQIPGKAQGGRHGMVFGQISSSSTIGNSPQKPLVPGQKSTHTLFLTLFFVGDLFYFFSFSLRIHPRSYVGLGLEIFCGMFFTYFKSILQQRRIQLAFMFVL